MVLSPQPKPDHQCDDQRDDHPTRGFDVFVQRVFGTLTAEPDHTGDQEHALATADRHAGNERQDRQTDDAAGPRRYFQWDRHEARRDQQPERLPRMRMRVGAELLHQRIEVRQPADLRQQRFHRAECVMTQRVADERAAQRTRKWWLFASISLAGSLCGSFVGYALGHYAFGAVKPLLAQIGWLPHLDALVKQLGADAHAHPWEAFWLLVAAGFVPIPLKVSTWACGIVGLPILPFIAGMAIGRGKRVFLVAGVIRLGGERAEHALHKHIETTGWVIVALIVALVVWFWLR